MAAAYLSQYTYPWEALKGIKELIISLGATLQDLVDIMMDYGAVNACNLDGGSSTLMWYQGDYVNNCASVIGIRPMPTTILVLKEGENGNG